MKMNALQVENDRYRNSSGHNQEPTSNMVLGLGSWFWDFSTSWYLVLVLGFGIFLWETSKFRP